ncbi:MAG TPA: ATP-binding protein, partial [Desulfatiglandales bacterium]|nr:ATP-binding protein [Desulfatiglandales bacterium]
EDLKALLTKIEKAKKEWESTMDCIGEMVIVIDDAGKIQRCNRAFKDFAERPYNKIKGEEWKDLLHDVEMLTSPHNENSIELYHKPTGRWFVMNNYPYQEGGSNLISWTVITISENTDLKLFSQELQAKNKEIEENEKALEKAYAELKSTQAKIIHSEKMASIGQLAAGVAHEINNPTGFISSNLNTLEDYEKDLTSLINCYKAFFSEFKKDMITAENQTEIFEKMGHMAKLEKEIDLDFILEDTPKLIKECQEGARRIKQIVFDLKDFAHPGDQELKYADINKILDSTLNIVWNEIKYKATVDKNYGDLPDVQCYPQQLNQVFMNVLVNAAQAIEKEGKITIATRALNGRVEIAISDTGVGIPKENIPKIFDPFYTTKDVGKGTGLGLNVAYNIIKKHQGSIYVNSEVGKGTTFTVRLKIELEMEN